MLNKLYHPELVSTVFPAREYKATQPDGAAYRYKAQWVEYYCRVCEDSYVLCVVSCGPRLGQS